MFGSNEGVIMQIKKDAVVSMHYTLTLDSGEIIDSSEGSEPLSFLCGHSQIIPGLENELIDMKIGDKKSVTIQPEDGYGSVNEQLYQVIARDEMPPDVEVKKGLVLTGQNDDGRQFEVVVKSYTDTEVVLDLNHPLAGEVLHFETEIVDIRLAEPEELDHGHAH